MATIAPGIRLDEAGVAWIEGTTAKVIEIALIKLTSDLTPEEIQQELPHLSLAQVHAALAYYYAHQEELDADIARRRQWVDEMRDKAPSWLTRKELLVRLNG